MRAKIEKLIKIGKGNFKSHKKAKYYIDSEYCIVYSNAVNVLLENFNPNTEKEINKLFEEKIPKLFDNKECKNVLEEFENLKNNDLTLRLKASIFFRQKALNSIIGFRSMIFKRPDTLEQLILALKKENNEKIIINLIITLGGIYKSYFKHFHIYETLSPYFYHKKSEVRYYTVIWTRGMGDEKREVVIKQMLSTEKSKKVRKAIENEPLNSKEFYKSITTENSESEFQVRFLENEGIGLLTTKNDKDYLVLDSLEHWDELTQEKYPNTKKCECKNEWFKIYYFYEKRMDCDDIKKIKVLTDCIRCNKVSEALCIEIDYSPTDKLLSEPITLYEKFELKNKTTGNNGYK